MKRFITPDSTYSEDAKHLLMTTQANSEHPMRSSGRTQVKSKLLSWWSKIRSMPSIPLNRSVSRHATLAARETIGCLTWEQLLKALIIQTNLDLEKYLMLKLQRSITKAIFNVITILRLS